MGRIRVIGRLAVRDIRYRPAQAILLLLVITAATAVLSLGLVLRGVTNQPYQQTKAATRGPDVVADLFSGPDAITQAQLASKVSALTHIAGVTGSTGPYLVAPTVLLANGHRAAVEAEGRDQAPAAIDQSVITADTWVRPGGVVLERTFAEGLGVTVGSKVTLGGQAYTVVGIAVTAAAPPYPNLCHAAMLCGGLNIPVTSRDFGMAWVTRPAARALATTGAGRRGTC